MTVFFLWAHKKVVHDHLITSAIKEYSLQCSVSSVSEQSPTARPLALWEMIVEVFSDQRLVFRDDALGEDAEVRPVRGAAVRGPHHTGLCDHGEVCRPHTGRERRGSDGLLAGGGRLGRLRDLRDPAGVGASEVSDPEEEEIHHGDHTVVSTAIGKNFNQCHGQNG